MLKSKKPKVEGNKIDIDHLAKLANLDLSPSEKQKFQKQLTLILEYFVKLQEVNTSNIKSTKHFLGIQNIARIDMARPSLSQDQALSNTKQKHNGFFKIKAIL
jgi:aspartyl-tRNA(Asn)/glutamyl-tRNA(Gln) amidotransferase subunit C